MTLRRDTRTSTVLDKYQQRNVYRNSYGDYEALQFVKGPNLGVVFPLSLALMQQEEKG
ncbi:MAG: hypothetical protein V3W37_02365 [Candidatus Binatia bacterium]